MSYNIIYIFYCVHFFSPIVLGWFDILTEKCGVPKSTNVGTTNDSPLVEYFSTIGEPCDESLPYTVCHCRMHCVTKCCDSMPGQTEENRRYHDFSFIVAYSLSSNIAIPRRVKQSRNEYDTTFPLIFVCILSQTYALDLSTIGDPRDKLRIYLRCVIVVYSMPSNVLQTEDVMWFVHASFAEYLVKRMR